jgi:hypothetical protein
MNLLAIEMFLAAFALKRGWRKAPLGLVALPIAVAAFESALSSLLGAWLLEVLAPPGNGRALAHGFALPGLIVTCCAGPSQLPVLISRLLARLSPRDSGPLYQI